MPAPDDTPKPRRPRKKPSAPANSSLPSGSANINPPQPSSESEDTDSKAIIELIQATMDWYLMKLSGDPMMEVFDILMMVEGPKGRMSTKYVLGGYDESMPRLRKDLETDHADCDRYVCAWRGWWEKPDGAKFDGALLCIESRHILPAIFGLPIARSAEGHHSIAGELQRLSLADWSLLHRQPT